MKSTTREIPPMANTARTNRPVKNNSIARSMPKSYPAKLISVSVARIVMVPAET